MGEPPPTLPPVAGRPDIALVSLRTTIGWQRADDAFAEHVRAAGATCEVRPIAIGASGRLRRSMALTDLVEALAARRAARGVDARAIVYSSVTAALLQPPRSPSAVRFDAIAALNRPGTGGAGSAAGSGRPWGRRPCCCRGARRRRWLQRTRSAPRRPPPSWSHLRS